MVPISPRSIFRSRWMALLWADGIVWSAVEFVGTQPDRDADSSANANAAVLNAFG